MAGCWQQVGEATSTRTHAVVCQLFIGKLEKMLWTDANAYEGSMYVEISIYSQKN